MQALDQLNELLNEVNLLLEETRSALEDADNAKTPIEKRKHLFRANTFARSGIVLLCGHFEGFLKALLGEFASEFNNAKVKADVVPLLLLETVVETVLKRCSSGKETHRQQLQNLMTGKTTIEMDSEIFSNTGGNPKVDVVEKMLNRIGILDALEELTKRDFGVSTHTKKPQFDSSFISRVKQTLSSLEVESAHINRIQAEIINIVESKWTSKSIRRDVGYIATIQELLKKRNLIAHGEDHPDITDIELERFINEIRLLATGLDQITSRQLALICYKSI